ncbi:hypothetical protein OSG_eHP12_00100 [environmental Halophage eHP-12]|nr:hypothetical protein OSG_eHP12_00100 [environmental Halophage eHP-12]
MTFEPDLADPETDGSIFDRIASTIASLSPITNFSVNSPERALISGVSDELRERQHELLSVQLSARVNFAGRTLSESDLESLNVDASKVNLQLLNSFQADSDLDAVAARNGITRDPGSFASGSVTFQITSDAAVIPEGTEVTTDPVGADDPIRFATTAEVAADSGDTQLTAPIEAVERGRAGNVGSGAITRIPSPPPLVGGDPAVTNPAATTGGENEESNAELRERTRNALVGSAGGGTTEGVESGLVEAFDGLDLEDVLIDESASVQPGFEVVVDGGPSDAVLKDEIDVLQPVAIEGTLVRPTDVTIDVTASVTGTGIDTTAIEDSVVDLISGLGLGGDVVRDQLIVAIMTADDGITGIDSLSTSANGTSFSGDKTIGPRESPEPGTVSVTVV